MTYQGSERHLSGLAAARQLANAPIPCRFCLNEFSKANLRKHEKSCSSNPSTQKECPVCATMFSSKHTCCSTACANTFFRTGTYHGNGYRSICFNHHKRECVVCGEDKIVEVHHLDENHSNDDPANLIPLCPTHHRYWHSRYKPLVEPQILAYIKNWAPPHF